MHAEQSACCNVENTAMSTAFIINKSVAMGVFMMYNLMLCCGNFPEFARVNIYLVHSSTGAAWLRAYLRMCLLVNINI